MWKGVGVGVVVAVGEGARTLSGSGEADYTRALVGGGVTTDSLISEGGRK